MRGRPSQVEFATFLRAQRGEVATLAAHVAGGTITPDEFRAQMGRLLVEAHAQAAYLGRLRAGDLAPFERDDHRFGELVASDESAFLQAFAADLTAGRYRRDDGSVMRAAIMQRARLYAERLLGTANETFALASGGLIRWELGGSEHCDDCPPLAAGSPYRAETLTIYPRSGHTQCLVQCACRLVRGDGVGGFRPD